MVGLILYAIGIVRFFRWNIRQFYRKLGPVQDVGICLKHKREVCASQTSVAGRSQLLASRYFHLVCCAQNLSTPFQAYVQEIIVTRINLNELTLLIPSIHPSHNHTHLSHHHNQNLKRKMSANAFQPSFQTHRASALWAACQTRSPMAKIVAQEIYHLQTFSIMLELDTRQGHICTPIIVATDEDLDSLKRSIRRMFAIEDRISLTVAWEGSGIHFATVEQDRELVNESTFAILRLLQQRNGVDKLLVKEEEEVDL